MEQELLKLNHLITLWAAASGAAKDILFKNIIDFMVKHPQVAEFLVKGAPQGAFAREFAKRAGITAVGGIAARSAARLPFNVYLARVAATFGTSPKGPHPMLMAVAAVGAVVATSAEARADTMERQNAVPRYEEYVTNYIVKMTLAKQYHPQNNAFPSPKTFDEWYEENR